MNARRYVLLRRISQGAAVLMLCALPWLNAQEINVVSGNFFALHFGPLPFADPAGPVQVLAGGHIPGSGLLLGALAALILALCLGRVFCSWVCPYGLISESIHRLSSKWGCTPAQEKPFSGFVIRCCVFVLGILATVLVGFPVLNRLSLPGELSQLPLLLRDGGLPWVLLLMLAMLLFAELCTGKRLWCRFLCPQSVLLSLAARFSPGMRVKWQAQCCTCGPASPCRQACSLGLNPRHKEGPDRLECTNCGDCIKVCALHGNALRFGKGGK